MKYPFHIPYIIGGLESVIEGVKLLPPDLIHAQIKGWESKIHSATTALSMAEPEFAKREERRSRLWSDAAVAAIAAGRNPVDMANAVVAAFDRLFDGPADDAAA